LRGMLGVYPFRCRKCMHRFSTSIWLFRKLCYAKCPRCLGLELSTWSRRYYKVGFLKGFLIVFGAQKYRCKVCRCNFVSFRPRKASLPSTEQPASIGSRRDGPVGAESVTPEAGQEGALHEEAALIAMAAEERTATRIPDDRAADPSLNG
jgi:hypothetical protein